MPLRLDPVSSEACHGASDRVTLWLMKAPMLPLPLLRFPRLPQVLRAMPFLLLLLLAPSLSRAIPNSFIGNGFIGPIVPAHPRFGANLTAGFLELAHWEGPAAPLPGPWETVTATPGHEIRQMTAMPVLFGAVPDSVIAWGAPGGPTREVVITYLDAGSFFPYLAGGEKTHAQRTEGADRRGEFDSAWHRLSDDLRGRLEAGCGPGVPRAEGRSDLLRTIYTEYAWEDFRLRLARREGHSITLHLSPLREAAPGPIAGDLAGLSGADRAARLADRVESLSSGGWRIRDIPVFDQGFTPYCGIHALAMVAHYHGLRLPPGALAAGADFANTGSARGSRTLDLYREVGEELGLDCETSSRFDADRVERAIRAGLPVLVWRRVSEEREKAHADLAKRLATAPALPIPALTAPEIARLPERTKKGTPSHASVIH
ncbi:MAG: hypothetical protein KDM63_19250, partial [Verrucomicrobiae bacterium]|nr:hypothetical protein [Verrucomicrobiae bacterium]